MQRFRICLDIRVIHKGWRPQKPLKVTIWRMNLIFPQNVDANHECKKKDWIIFAQSLLVSFFVGSPVSEDIQNMFRNKELSLCFKLWCTNPCIFTTRCRTPYIFQTMNFVIPNKFEISKVYDIGLQRYKDYKSEFVAKTNCLLDFNVNFFKKKTHYRILALQNPWNTEEIAGFVF